MKKITYCCILMTFFFSYGFSGPLNAQEKAGKTESPIVIERILLQKLEKLFAEKNYNELVDECQPAIEKYSRSMAFYYVCGLGYLYVPVTKVSERNINLGKSIRAFEEAEHVYSMNPKVRETYLNLLFHLALAWQLSGNRNMAVHVYKKLLVLNDRKLEAIYNLAVCHEEEGRIIEANRAYLRFLAVQEEGEEEF